MKDYKPLEPSSKSVFGKYFETREKRRQEFMSHVSLEIKARIFENPEPIGLTEYQNMRINSYEQKVIESRLTDEAFIWKMKNALQQSAAFNDPYTVSTTYSEYLLHEGIEVLVNRFEKLSRKC